MSYGSPILILTPPSLGTHPLGSSLIHTWAALTKNVPCQPEIGCVRFPSMATWLIPFSIPCFQCLPFLVVFSGHMIHLALVPFSHCGHQSLVSQTLPTPPLRQPDVIHSMLKFSKGHRCKAHPRPVFHQRELRAPLECPQPFEPVVQRSKLVPLCACLVSVHQGGGTQSRDPLPQPGCPPPLGPQA